jgi:hypothetical protein
MSQPVEELKVTLIYRTKMIYQKKTMVQRRENVVKIMSFKTFKVQKTF